MSAFIIFVLALAASVYVSPYAAAADERLVAKVGDTDITASEFAAAYERAKRQRFYHGAPPGEQQQAFRREVAEELITRVLLLQEARRRGLKADQHAIRKELDRYDQRYRQNPSWQQRRERLLAELKQRLAEDDLLRQLERQARQVGEPDEDQLKAYFQANPEKFTEPARDRVSLILLRVDPSSPASVWQAALGEARRLVGRLRQGEDFAELARLHSADASAANGGDMGYLHRGMLSAPAEQAIEPLNVGEITDPVRVLEGVAVFRLDQRRPSRRHRFGEVRNRVLELWQRDQSKQAWQMLQQRLRARTPITLIDPALRS